MAERQKTVGIDDALWKNLDLWLKTSEAKKRGFHSKAQFANQAIGDLLMQHKDHIYTYAEIIKEMHQSHKNLSDRFDKQLKFVEQLERFWFKSTFPNIESKTITG